MVWERINYGLATCAFIVLIVAFTASLAFAHPGGTASDGCHYCRTNCAKWGETTGARHCHGRTRPPEPEEEEEEDDNVSGRAVVIDGDDIEVSGSRIRLYGIDAPESRQTCLAGGQRWACGEQATRELTDRIGSRTVTCEERDRDSYGRIVAVCQLAGQDLNAWLVAQGWALAYRQYSQSYVDEEAVARAARRGIWRGNFVAPWDWRRGVRLQVPVLENPGPNSYQSGIGVISGWACDAESIEIEFQHGTTRTVTTFIAGYGTSRSDTMGVCEDDGNNGFSLLFNWNILGDGLHTVRALADGVEFARRTFTVSTLNSEEFARGLSGGFVLPNFPHAGQETTIRWEESLQNFMITGTE